jgi:hypothetical protein
VLLKDFSHSFDMGGIASISNAKQVRAGSEEADTILCSGAEVVTDSSKKDNIMPLPHFHGSLSVEWLTRPLVTNEIHYLRRSRCRHWRIGSDGCSWCLVALTFRFSSSMDRVLDVIGLIVVLAEDEAPGGEMLIRMGYLCIA